MPAELEQHAVKSPVGMSEMILTATLRFDGWYVIMHCRRCHKSVCMYNITDLAELGAEYGAHIAEEH